MFFQEGSLSKYGLFSRVYTLAMVTTAQYYSVRPIDLTTPNICWLMCRKKICNLKLWKRNFCKKHGFSFFTVYFLSTSLSVVMIFGYLMRWPFRLPLCFYAFYPLLKLTTKLDSTSRKMPCEQITNFIGL